MMIDKEVLDKFKSIYKEEFGEEITDREAEDKFGRLINVLGIIFKYVNKDANNSPITIIHRKG